MAADRYDRGTATSVAQAGARGLKVLSRDHLERVRDALESLNSEVERYRSILEGHKERERQRESPNEKLLIMLDVGIGRLQEIETLLDDEVLDRIIVLKDIIIHINRASEGKLL